MNTEMILILGAGGQIGTELTTELRKAYSDAQVVMADIRPLQGNIHQAGPFEVVNVMDKDALLKVVRKYKITQIYHLAAILSATGEKDPQKAWSVNMDGLFNVIELALQEGIKKVFWPSSIAVFGKRAPKRLTPQYTITDPQTIYGISKLAGERWCHYYYHNHGLDIRSLRYPGLISHIGAPGGGTTDYAVEIYYEALAKQKYTCFLKEDQMLPMMYMPDALRATLELMEAPADKLRVHSSYNISSMAFTPKTLAESICKHIPDFEINYEPDQRQKIAQAWPGSIDDNYARVDWGWEPKYDLHAMTADMLDNIAKKQG